MISSRRDMMRIAWRAVLTSSVCAAGVMVARGQGFSQTNPAPTSEAGKAAQSFKLIPSLDKDVMDTAADPCVDFYRYACGNWSELHPIPNDSPYSDQFYNLDQYNRQVLHGILESASATGGARDANAQKIGDYYASWTGSTCSPAKISSRSCWRMFN
jgi:putative endopeptidase